jgi:hypothetical protein
VRLAALLLVCAACHRGGDKERPSSCVIEHDGGVTQCFEDVGLTARTDGAKYCARMHGHHTFRASKPCPTEGLLASCTKRAGTEWERVERCYRDEPACRARCDNAHGEYRPVVAP